MKHFVFGFLLAPALSATSALAQKMPGEQEAIDGCIDQVRTVGGAGAAGGEVLSSEFSEAGTLVMLRDGGGTTWRCIGYKDGSVGDLAVVEDAFASSQGSASSAPQDQSLSVKFAPGSTGATYSADLGSSDAVRYVLNARNGQFLTVDLRGNSDLLNYIIYVPGGDILFESSQGGYAYTGQLYKTGDHLVEVFYNGNQGTVGSYDISFEIK